MITQRGKQQHDVNPASNTKVMFSVGSCYTPTRSKVRHGVNPQNANQWGSFKSFKPYLKMGKIIGKSLENHLKATGKPSQNHTNGDPQNRLHENWCPTNWVKPARNTHGIGSWVTPVTLGVPICKRPTPRAFLPGSHRQNSYNWGGVRTSFNQKQLPLFLPSQDIRHWTRRHSAEECAAHLHLSKSSRAHNPSHAIGMGTMILNQAPKFILWCPNLIGHQGLLVLPLQSWNQLSHARWLNFGGLNALIQDHPRSTTDHDSI